MTRERIRSNNPKDPRRKVSLLGLLSENEIYVNRIFLTNDGFNIYTLNDGDLDRLFNGTTDKYLESKGFFPVIPPELKANRSVILFSVDSHMKMI